jgi:hypothetical protein
VHVSLSCTKPKCWVARWPLVVVCHDEKNRDSFQKKKENRDVLPGCLADGWALGK